MFYPDEQFAIEHMGWEKGTKEPTEKQIVEAKEKHEADKKVARDEVLKKLGLTADEVAILFL